MHAVASPEDEELALFLKTMPSAYARVFDRDDVLEQMRIVKRRGDAAAHAGVWRTLPDGGVVGLIVADDRPGLLSLVSAALVAHRLDVTSAQIYCRERPDGVLEAVDLFWLRAAEHGKTPRCIEPEELTSVACLLSELIVEEGRAALESKRPPLGPFEPGPSPRVFFDVRALRRGEFVLVVETRDSPGLLLSITRALFRKDVEIVASDVRTENGVARDRFTLCGPGGAPLGADRLADVQREVLTALRALRPRPL